MPKQVEVIQEPVEEPPVQVVETPKAVSVVTEPVVLATEPVEA